MNLADRISSPHHRENVWHLRASFSGAHYHDASKHELQMWLQNAPDPSRLVVDQIRSSLYRAKDDPAALQTEIEGHSDISDEIPRVKAENEYVRNFLLLR